MKKLIPIMMPMVVVAVMTTINAHNNYVGNSSIADFLGNAASLVLALVFILPELKQSTRNTESFESNDVYLLFIFISLALSSIPPKYQVSDTNYCALFGVILLWSSFAFPISNYFAYRRIYEKVCRRDKRTIDKNNKDHGQHCFAPDSNYKRWSEKYFLNDFSYVHQLHCKTQRFKIVKNLWTFEEGQNNCSKTTYCKFFKKTIRK